LILFFLLNKYYSLVCCCRRQSCATHAVIQNIFGFIFACVLIGLNIAFIQEPNKCFFTEGICQKLSWTSYVYDSIECLVDGLSTGCGNTRISLIKAQLASAVLMAATCLIYLIIYGIINMRTSKASRCTPSEAVMAPVYQSNQQPLTISHHHQSYTVSSHPSAPGMMTLYPAPPSDGHYLPPNQYPQIGNERF
jgi:hypothetical protein